jgi:hypothetical protein
MLNGVYVLNAELFPFPIMMAYRFMSRDSLSKSDRLRNRRLGFHSRKGYVLRALGHTQSPIQSLMGARGVKRRGSEGATYIHVLPRSRICVLLQPHPRILYNATLNCIVRQFYLKLNNRAVAVRIL